MCKVHHRALLWTGALAPLVALSLYLTMRYEGPRILVGDDWCPERLRQELMRRGVVYEAHKVTLKDARRRGLDPGYYFKRPSDGRSWDELASLPRFPMNGTMRGFVVVTARALGEPVRPETGCDLEWGHVYLGRLILHGDPAELRRILAALGYAPSAGSHPGKKGRVASPLPAYPAS